MKRRKHHRKKSPSDTQKRQVEHASMAVADRPAFGQPPAPPVQATPPEPAPPLPTGVASPPAKNWAPVGGAVNPVSYHHGGGRTRPPIPTAPPPRVSMELYVENRADADIILRHVNADEMAVLVENSLIEPGQTRRVLMVLAKQDEGKREDGFMFCQGQAKNQCVVRCVNNMMWVALQSGAINPQMHDMTAFTQSSFTGKRYLLCFNPPFKTH